jgi:hypothetical protein
MLGIKRIDKVSNDIVYEKVGRDKLTLQVQQRQLRFVGHSLRRNENDPITKYVLWAPDERHRQRAADHARSITSRLAS